jgi:hypothetical protein
MNRIKLKGFPKFKIVFKKQYGGSVSTVPSFETTPRKAYDSILRTHPKGYVVGVIQDHRFVA